MPIILCLTRLALEPSRATAVSMAVPFGRKLQELSGSTERERGERERELISGKTWTVPEERLIVVGGTGQRWEELSCEGWAGPGVCQQEYFLRSHYEGLGRLSGGRHCAGHYITLSVLTGGIVLREKLNKSDHDKNAEDGVFGGGQPGKPRHHPISDWPAVARHLSTGQEVPLHLCQYDRVVWKWTLNTETNDMYLGYILLDLYYW